MVVPRGQYGHDPISRIMAKLAWYYCGRVPCGGRGGN